MTSLDDEPGTLPHSPSSLFHHAPAALADLFGLAEVRPWPRPRHGGAASEVRSPGIDSSPASSWQMWTEGTTLDLLKRGPKYVVQHSSGVAWEALPSASR